MAREQRQGVGVVCLTRLARQVVLVRAHLLMGQGVRVQGVRCRLPRGRLLVCGAYVVSVFRPFREGRLCGPLRVFAACVVAFHACLQP